jgi:hypothetical protein
VSVLPAPIETKAATSYIDVGSGLDSLTIGSFYMFGAYAEESGTPYVYLLSNPAKGGYVRVPCLSKTDASHPCGITEADFTASCLSSILYAINYDTGYSFAFTDYLSALYADSSNSYALTMSTASSANAMTSVTFDSTATPETCTLSNWEYQITSPNATFQGFASTADSGFSTSLVVYPLTYTSFESSTAVGLSKGLSASGSTYTASTAQAAYQGLSYAQRQLFSYYINGVKTEATATQAAENILIAGVSAYQALLGSASKPFQSKTPSLSIDYSADAITGFDDDETYYHVLWDRPGHGDARLLRRVAAFRSKERWITSPTIARVKPWPFIFITIRASAVAICPPMTSVWSWMPVQAPQRRH